MDELLKKLFAALPFFGTQLSGLLTGPKTDILNQDLESDSALQRALTFLAVSFALTYIALIPLVAGSQNRLTFGVTAIHSAIAFSLNVALVVLVWKVVGARLPWKKMVVVTCYFCGVSNLLFLVAILIAAGAYHLLDPVNYHHMITGTASAPDEIGDDWGGKVLLIVLALGLIAVYAWIFYIWETYRQLAQVSKSRSAVALILFTILSPTLLVLQLLMGYSFTPGDSPFVPRELVGKWQSSQQFDNQDAHAVVSVTYQFAPPKYRISPLSDYSAVLTKRGTNARCAVTVEERQSGKALLLGTAITLYPYHHNISIQNGCNGTNSNSFIDLKQVQYQYQINQQPTGWTLCFSDRFGPPSCLKAARD